MPGKPGDGVQIARGYDNCDDGRRSGRPAVAEMYDLRAAEYREYADMIRRVVLQSFNPAIRPPQT